MLDIIAEVRAWASAGQKFALATVIETWGSSPRAVGARMAVRHDGVMAGSVSGGCVEGAVVQEALDVIGGGTPRLLKYGVTDETAWDVGLACGGSIEIFVQGIDGAMLEAIEDIDSERRVLAVASVIAGPPAVLGMSGVYAGSAMTAGNLAQEVQEAIAPHLQGAYERTLSTRAAIEVQAEACEIFLGIILPAPTLIMIGGVHISIALVNLARALGYRTIVIDPRKSFAAEERFSQADQLIQMWPEQALAEVGIDANTAVAVLTHDPKIDDPALLTALRSPAFYVGALGSRTTHAKRVERLRGEGLKSDALARLKAPIGLDLGGRTPEEIALSILAEITATRHRKLSDVQ